MIKEDWVECEAYILGNLIRGVNYKKPQSSDMKKEDYLPILRANNIDNHSLNFENLKYVEKGLIKSEQKILRGDIVFAMSSGSKHLVGKSAQAQNDYQGSFGAFCAVYRPNENIYPHFIQYYFHSGDFRKLISNASKGSNINNLKREHVLNSIIPLPPLPIQRAIVSKIETLFSDLDKGIADLKKAQDQLKIYRQAVLKKAFEGELTKEWREQQTDLPTAEELLDQIKEERQKHYDQQLEEWKQAVKAWEENGKVGKKPGKPKAIVELPILSEEELYGLPEISKFWNWCKVDKIAGHNANSLKAGPFGSSLKKEFYTPQGYKVYGQEQVISGDSTFGDYYVNEAKYNDFINCAVFPLDILISLVGTVGKVLVLPKDAEMGIINPRLVKITLNSCYDSIFFKYYFESSFLKSLYKVKNHGTTMDVLNLTSIKELPFPLCSIQEQHQIIREIESRLSVCDKVEQNIAEALEKSEALRQSILKKAFEGKLLSETEVEACKKEADYEPASFLLERIKKEKTNA